MQARTEQDALLTIRETLIVPDFCCMVFCTACKVPDAQVQVFPLSFSTAHVATIDHLYRHVLSFLSSEVVDGQRYTRKFA
jgi:hypothetical protein